MFLPVTPELSKKMGTIANLFYGILTKFISH